MKRYLLAGACAALLLATFSCALFAPLQTDQGPSQDEQAQDERVAAVIPVPPEEPVLTVDEVYDAISLSVRSGNPDEALAAYQEAELADPDDPENRVLLANLYLIAGAIDEADELLASILAEEPQNTEALYIRSLVAGSRGDLDAQRETLQRILEIAPDDTRALASLGEVYLQKREFDEAERTFVAALELDDADLVARMGLGNVYLREEEYEAAEEQFSAAVELEPTYPYSFSDRARARALQRELSGADADLTTAIELDPDYPWHYVDRGRVRLEQRRFDDAAGDFARAIELNPESFIGYVLRARAYDALQQVEPARSDYAEALALRPDYYPAYAPYATLLYLSERPGEAAEYYREAFEEEPRRLDFALLAALSLKADDEEEAAREWLTAQLSQFPRESLHYQMARYYLLPTNEGYILGEISRSQENIVKGQMYFFLGAQLELLGRTETARASLLEAEDTLPPGIVERRLAVWHLQAYRSPAEEGE
jgi:tetratricopeptide (TPR) repeat protein